jgi:hypothetical protein
MRSINDWRKPTTIIISTRNWFVRRNLSVLSRHCVQQASLGQQFRETAFTYGRLIISERAIDPAHRTIKPVSEVSPTGVHFNFFNSD